MRYINFFYYYLLAAPKLPVPCSLFPVPCSLKPRNLYLMRKDNCYID
ncbi:MAG: hypothetical protein F6J98_06060 [Moorea sp. SIO4G2]|nr:hypothetical protein [Moorena sp. SIO4G2]